MAVTTVLRFTFNIPRMLLDLKVLNNDSISLKEAKYFLIIIYFMYEEKSHKPAVYDQQFQHAHNKFKALFQYISKKVFNNFS